MRQRLKLKLLLLLASFLSPFCQPVFGAGLDVISQSNCNESVRPNILIIYDLEGISQVRSSRAILAGNEFYEKARRAAPSDVNAVVDGLFRGGAETVTVVDGHGSGAPKPDIVVDDLDPRVELLLRDRPFFPLIEFSSTKTYDGVVLVGYKSRTRGGGFAAHTRTFGLEFLVEEKPVNEVELIAMAFGQVNTPVMMVSGDDVLADELSQYPWIEYAEVKQTINTRQASPVRPRLAMQKLMRAAASAMRRRCDASIVKLSPKTSVGLRALPPASFAGLKNVPGIRMADPHTFTFVAEGGFMDAHKGWSALTSVALGGWFGAVRMELSHTENEKGVNENTLFLALIRAWERAEMGEDLPLPEPTEPAIFNGVR